MQEEADARLELGGRALEGGVGLVVAPGSAAGSTMLQWIACGLPGNSGQTSRTRSQRLMTWSKRCRLNVSRCFVRTPEMSIPSASITRTAFGCRLFGRLPALNASTVPADRSRSSASAICERALLPVQRKSTRGFRERGSSSVAGRGPGLSAG